MRHPHSRPITTGSLVRSSELAADARQFQVNAVSDAEDQVAAWQVYAELKAAKEAQIQAAQEDRKRLHEGFTAADLTVFESKQAR